MKYYIYCYDTDTRVDILLEEEEYSLTLRWFNLYLDYKIIYDYGIDLKQNFIWHFELYIPYNFEFKEYYSWEDLISLVPLELWL